MKTYKNVSEMILDLHSDKEKAQKIVAKIESTRIVRRMKAFRVATGLSQKLLAKAIGCSQSWVAKIELKEDKALTIDDMTTYLTPLGVKYDIDFIKTDLR